MTEIGPFCYEKVTKRADIRHGANRQIKYHNTEYFVEGWDQKFSTKLYCHSGNSIFISVKVDDPTRNCMDLDTSLTSFNVPFPLVMRTLESMSQVYQDLFLTMIPPQDCFDFCIFVGTYYGSRLLTLASYV